MNKNNIYDRAADSEAEKASVNTAAQPNLDDKEITTPYKNILDTLPDWVWEIDMNGYITYSNPAVKCFLGYSPEQLIDTSFFQMVPENDSENARMLLSNEWDQESKNKYIRHIFVSGEKNKILLETHGSAFYDGTTHDSGIRFVSRIVGDEATRRDSKTRMAVYAANNINEAIAVINPEMLITYINEPFSELFGYSEKEILGKSLSTLGTDESSTSFQPEHIVNELENSSVWYGQVSRRSRNGEYIPCILSARSFFDRNGKFLGFTGTYMDLRHVKNNALKIQNSLKSIINAVCNTIEQRSVIKNNHQERVTDLAVAIAIEMGMDIKFIEGLTLACQLHDIGEMFIPPEIANKVGKLSDTDFELIKTHPKKGYEIIKELDLPWSVANIILQHHERINGSGYPFQLQNEDIMMEARILGVADVAETMLTDRPYRPACTLDQCLEELENNKGILYDNRVTEICIKLLREKHYFLK